jgi:hypothetical protein
MAHDPQAGHGPAGGPQVTKRWDLAMPQLRHWPRDATRAALLFAAPVLPALLGDAWFRGEQCYSALRVGMSAAEADAILARHGYTLAGGDGNLMEMVMVYRRHKAEPPIVLIFGADGVLKKTERDSLPEHLLQSLSDQLRGYED